MRVDRDAKRDPLREFTPDIVSQLGRAMFEEDRLAWVATDVLIAAIGRDRLTAENAAGWVVDATGTVPLVRFLRHNDTGVEARFDISFSKAGKPEMTVPDDRKLTPYQQAKTQALKTADAALRSGKRPWCQGSYNFVVLPDPDGSGGFLVYFLRAKPSMAEIPVGGHYRITVSADGKTAKQVDQLFASCLTISKTDVPKGAEPAALVMNHIVSKTPVETHVFLSLQEKTPFYVTDPEGGVWQIENGILSRTELNARSDKK